MYTVEDVLGRLQRSTLRLAPSWRVRIAFKDGSEWEQVYEPGTNWPAALVDRPPLRFIARQTMALVRFYLKEHGMEAVRVEIDPPPGTIDDRGRAVRGEIVLAIVKVG
jgi:hypothetical protein